MSSPPCCWLATLSVTPASPALAVCGEVRGFWQFENNLTDASGCANHGSGPASYGGGYAGQGLTHTAEQAPIPVTNNANSLTISGNQITLEAWVKSSNYGTGFHHVIDNFNSYTLSVTDGRIASSLHGGGNWFQPTVPTLSPNVWHHLAATYDGSTDRLYVDGIQVASREFRESINPTLHGVAIAGAGNPGQNAYLFNGTIDNVRVTARALAAAEIATNYLARKVYLPFVTTPPYIKTKSGLHMGSRDDDWRPDVDFFKLIRGDPSQGRYPAAVVVLSNNLSDIQRDGNCNITGVIPRSNNLFNYLVDASRRGVRVIIRINPSPGNFDDVVDASLTHRLLTAPGQIPINGLLIPCSQRPSEWRTFQDVALEIKFIHAYNQTRGLYEYSFEPANEPNKEWYEGIPDSDTNLKDAAAWLDMDLYFTNLYLDIHPSGGVNPGIRVLTPPMAQTLWAEPRLFYDCSLVANDLGFSSGYDLMVGTYGNGVGPANDGYSWHNYWIKGKEAWALNDPCPSGNTNPASNHLVQFFPGWLQAQIASSPHSTFITEADLLSTCISLTGNNGDVTDKDQAGGSDAANSLRNFIAQENSGDYVVAWILTTQYSDSASCEGGGQNEIAWHEAYRDNGGGAPRLWFTQWWTTGDQ